MCGAIKWRKLLRELKGEFGIWERYKSGKNDDEADAVPSIDEEGRWKLDLSEGPERMRRKMHPNYEFYKVYNVSDGNFDSAEGADLIDRSLSVDESSLPPSVVANDENVQSMLEHEDVEVTAAFVKQMQLRAGKQQGSKKGLSKDGENDYADDDDVGENDEERESHDAAILSDLAAASDVDMDDTDAEEDDSGPVAGVTPGSVDGIVTEGPLRPRRSTDSPALDGLDEVPSSVASAASVSASSVASAELLDFPPDAVKESFSEDNDVNATNFEMLSGLVQPTDLPDVRRNKSEKICYNVSRCTGLEVREALLLFCKRAIYIIDGFQMLSGDGLDGTIERVTVEESKFDVHLRRSGQSSAGPLESESRAKWVDEREKREGGLAAPTHKNSVSFQHRCQRIPFDEIFSVYKRRYQLRQIALEFFDCHRSSILIAFSSTNDRDSLLSQVLKTPLPNSIFNSNRAALASSGSGINYKKFMANLRNKITSRWVNGTMTNFEYLMYLNTFAGRTYNDLTQYPVFPWVLSNYTSEEIDLGDESNYRDLSKPMGALGESRAEQFKERLEEAATLCSAAAPLYISFAALLFLGSSPLTLSLTAHETRQSQI